MKALAVAMARLPARIGSPYLVALALAVPLLLVVARALPADGVGLALRLGAAVCCVLVLPGALALRAIGWPRDPAVAVAGSVVWSLFVVFAALVVTFATGGRLSLTLALTAGLGIACLLPAALAPGEPLDRSDVAVFAGIGLAAVGLGIVVWAASGPVAGDGLFHLARERKLAELDLSSLRSVDEFRDGGLHPGYAFPLWHGTLALVARLAGVDVTQVAEHVGALLVPLALLVAFAAGRALFRSSWAGAAVAVASATLVAVAPGHGGGYATLAQPGTAARQLVVPAVLALVFTYVRDRSPSLLLAIAAGGLALALIHPTYALFLAIVLAGFLVARALLAGEDAGRIAAAIAAASAPAAGVAVWLLPIARQTASHEPSQTELAREVRHYSGQLDVSSLDSFRLSPEVFGRGGAVAIAALVLVPLAALAPRRRWAALVLGGGLTVLLITLIPPLFMRLTDVVSLSQARRLAAFMPFAFAFAGGLGVLAAALGLVLLPVALAAGIVLQHFYPGNLADHLGPGAGGAATWIAAFGGAAAFALAVPLSRRLRVERQGPLVLAAAALFVLPVAVRGLENWGPSTRARPADVTPGLVAALRTDVPRGAVVFSDDVTSYGIAAYAPVYVASAPPGHVADTDANRPHERRRDALRFFGTGDLAIPRRYGASWVVLDRSRFRLRLPLTRVYQDRRFVLYRLR